MLVRRLETEVREEVAGDARITDLRVWRLGPGAWVTGASIRGDDGRGRRYAAALGG